MTIGNTNEGVLQDEIGDNLINGLRHQATGNITISNLHAKVGAITGKYKCAIYTDNSGLPGVLMGSTAEVQNPGAGWQTFGLTASVAITNGQYYWLAIWSDKIEAAVYYSSGSTPLRYGTYTYGAWPGSLTLGTAGTPLNYCIYGSGTATPVAPAATNMSITLLEDTVTNLTLMGSVGVYGIASNPTNGELLGLNTSSGTVSYSPNTNYAGADTIWYVVSNGSQQATGLVSLTITAVNDRPTLVLATNNVDVMEDSGSVTMGGFATMTVGPANESSQSVTNIEVLSISGAAIFAVMPVIGTNGTLTFTPAGNSNGMAMVSVQGRDNGGTANGGTNGSLAQIYTITITAANDAPVAYSQSVTNAEDAVLGITLEGSDEDGPVMNYSVKSNPAHGQLMGVTPSLTYHPDTNYFGSDSFTYEVSDGSLTSLVATVSITLSNVNDAPVAVGEDYELGSGGSLSVSAPGLLGNDSDEEGEGLTAVLAGGPEQGVLTLSQDGGFEYTPTNHFSGEDSFTYRASDGQAESGEATVRIGVSNNIEITSIGVTNGVVTMIWTALAGKGYRMQYKDELTEASWTDVMPEVMATGATAVGTNAVGVSNQRFYRVLCPGN
jgi:hypothetical protein